MRVFFVSMFLCLLTVLANAATFCAKPDKIVLGASVLKRPTATAFAGFDWSAYVPEFGTIRGVSSCSTLTGNSSVNLHDCRNSGYWGHVAASNGDVNENYYGRNDGKKCWCKMIHPFESGWVSSHLYNVPCEVECAIACAGNLKASNGGQDSLFRCMLATVGLND